MRLQKATSANITGTSTKTPTMVASAAPECKPNNAMATATANSKKLEALSVHPSLFQIESRDILI